MFIIAVERFMLLCLVLGAVVFIPAVVGFKTCRWVLAGAVVTFIACCALLGVGNYQHQTYAPPEYDIETITASVDVDQVAVGDTNSVECITFFNDEYYIYYITPTPTPIPHPEWLAEKT